MRITRCREALRLARFKKLSIGFAATLMIFTAQTSSVSHQDIASLFGAQGPGRWLMHIEEAPGETVASADLKELASYGIDPIVTGSLPNDKAGTRYLENPSFPAQVKTAVQYKRSPQRINRAAKGPRVVSTTAKQAPVHFSAGSVIERHSFLLAPEKPAVTGKKQAVAFVKSEPRLKSLQVATLFQAPKPDPRMIPADLPVMVASLVEESIGTSVLAYSPQPETDMSPFEAVLMEEDDPITFTPKLGAGDHAWAANPLPVASFSEKQQKCLARGIYFEARGEPVRGQAAVSQVILNRVRNPHYPNSICGVVYQNRSWRNRCQFSFACDRIRDLVRDKQRWEVAKHVAAETTAGRIWLPQVGSSTHYHATYVRPRWARRMKRVGRIGLHIFYRTFNGGWS